MSLYQIRPGFAFVDSDGSTKTGGETIDLDDEFARANAHKVQALQSPEAPAESPASWPVESA
jgi:hypothetical protein